MESLRWAYMYTLPNLKINHCICVDVFTCRDGLNFNLYSNWVSSLHVLKQCQDIEDTCHGLPSRGVSDWAWIPLFRPARSRSSRGNAVTCLDQPPVVLSIIARLPECRANPVINPAGGTPAGLPCGQASCDTGLQLAKVPKSIHRLVTWWYIHGVDGQRTCLMPCIV